MKALEKLEYGLFVLSSCENGKDNACIVNVVVQVTDSPERIAFTVNKKNLTHDMIQNTGMFTLSILTQDVPMDLIKRFGFQSGRDVAKFDDFEFAKRNKDGMLYIGEKYSNLQMKRELFRRKLLQPFQKRKRSSDRILLKRSQQFPCLLMKCSLHQQLLLKPG